jgi:hypothetical protein
VNYFSRRLRIVIKHNLREALLVGIPDYEVHSREGSD